MSRPYKNKPKHPEDNWPSCNICGEKCFSNPGRECTECNEYPLCNWCDVKNNCCRDKIIANSEWSDDKDLPKPVMPAKEWLQVITKKDAEGEKE